MRLKYHLLSFLDSLAIGLSILVKYNRVPVNFLNGYPGITSFSVATSTQNYINIKHARHFTQ